MATHVPAASRKMARPRPRDDEVGMDQPGAPEEPTADAVDSTPVEAPAPAPTPSPAVPLRDSALGALGLAAQVLRRPAFLWAPTVLSVLLTMPTVLVIPDAFFTGPMFGQQMSQAEARAFFELVQQQMGPFVLLTVLETLVFVPFLTVITYRLASDFLDGRPADPFGRNLLGDGARMLGSTLVLAAVFAGFLVAGSLIFALLVASGAGIFLLLLMPILIAFAAIVFLRLLPVPPLIVRGDGPVAGVQHAWSMSEGHVLRILRWGLVIWLASFAGGI